MDENNLYMIIGRLYSEILNSSSIIQNQNNVISQLQSKISDLESILSELNRGNMNDREEKPSVTNSRDEDIVRDYSPVPPQITNVSA